METSPGKKRQRAVSERDPEGLTHFLNVDLDLLSRSPLDGLVAAFGRRVSAHYVGREGRKYGAHLALATYPRDAVAAIRVFVALVTRLPRSARRAWDQATTRDFNIGVDAGFRPRSYEMPLDSRTVAAVAQVQGRIIFTVYAAELPRRR